MFANAPKISPQVTGDAPAAHKYKVILLILVNYKEWFDEIWSKCHVFYF